MICPHCNNEIKRIGDICQLCGGNLYEKPIEKNKLTNQEYIHDRLSKFGLNKNNDEILNEPFQKKWTRKSLKKRNES